MPPSYSQAARGGGSNRQPAPVAFAAAPPQPHYSHPMAHQAHSSLQGFSHGPSAFRHAAGRTPNKRSPSSSKSASASGSVAGSVGSAASRRAQATVDLTHKRLAQLAQLELNKVHGTAPTSTPAAPSASAGAPPSPSSSSPLRVSRFGAATALEQSLWQSALHDEVEETKSGRTSRSPRRDPRHMSPKQREQLLASTARRHHSRSPHSHERSHTPTANGLHRQQVESAALTAESMRAYADARGHSRATSATESPAFKPTLFVRTHSRTFSSPYTPPPVGDIDTSSPVSASVASAMADATMPTASPIRAPHGDSSRPFTPRSPGRSLRSRSPHSAGLLRLIHQLEDDLRSRLEGLADEFDETKRQKAERDQRMDRMRQVEHLLTSFPHASAIRDHLLSVLTESMADDQIALSESTSASKQVGTPNLTSSSRALDSASAADAAHSSSRKPQRSRAAESATPDPTLMPEHVSHSRRQPSQTATSLSQPSSRMPSHAPSPAASPAPSHALAGPGHISSLSLTSGAPRDHSRSRSRSGSIGAHVHTADAALANGTTVSSTAAPVDTTRPNPNSALAHTTVPVVAVARVPAARMVVVPSDGDAHAWTALAPPSTTQAAARQPTSTISPSTGARYLKSDTGVNVGRFLPSANGAHAANGNTAPNGHSASSEPPSTSAVTLLSSFGSRFILPPNMQQQQATSALPSTFARASVESAPTTSSPLASSVPATTTATGPFAILYASTPQESYVHSTHDSGFDAAVYAGHDLDSDSDDEPMEPLSILPTPAGSFSIPATGPATVVTTAVAAPAPNRPSALSFIKSFGGGGVSLLAPSATLALTYRRP